MSSLHSHSHEQPFPRGTLWFVGALIGAVLLAATVVRTGYIPVVASPENVRAAERLTPLKVRTLSFADRPDGGLTITDVGTGGIARAIKPGEPSGFIRGLLRGLSRERRMKNVAMAVPFRLESWPNGQLSLTDTGTGRSIELTAFGPTNRETFAELLK